MVLSFLERCVVVRPPSRAPNYPYMSLPCPWGPECPEVRGTGPLSCQPERSFLSNSMSLLGPRSSLPCYWIDQTKKWGLLGGLLGAASSLRLSKESGLPTLLRAVLPAVPFFPGTLPSTLPGTFGGFGLSQSCSRQPRLQSLDD